MFTKADIEKYFLAEKQAGLLFLVIGAIAIVVAVVFFLVLKTNFYKGAALPLVLIGILQLAVGIAVFKRSDEDRFRNVYAYGMDPNQLRDKELPRIKAVNKNFVLLRWVEVLLLLAGIGLMFYFKSNTGKTFWFGLGVALAIQAVLMLGADYFAEKRALQYTAGLEQFLKK
jgi:hypothetical protein